MNLTLCYYRVSSGVDGNVMLMATTCATLNFQLTATTLHIEGPNGRKIVLCSIGGQLSFNSTVSDIKRLVQEQHKIPAAAQILRLSDEILSNDIPLKNVIFSAQGSKLSLEYLQLQNRQSSYSFLLNKGIVKYNGKRISRPLLPAMLSLSELLNKRPSKQQLIEDGIFDEPVVPFYTALPEGEDSVVIYSSSSDSSSSEQQESDDDCIELRIMYGQKSYTSVFSASDTIRTIKRSIQRKWGIQRHLQILSLSSCLSHDNVLHDAQALDCFAQHTVYLTLNEINMYVLSFLFKYSMC